MIRPDMAKCSRDEMVAWVEHLEELLRGREAPARAALHADVGSARAGDGGTAKASAAKVPGAGSLRLAVLATIAMSGARGMTGDEVCATFPEKRSDSVRPRVAELVAGGFVRIVYGVTRPGASGKEQQVYAATGSGCAAVNTVQRLNPVEPPRAKDPAVQEVIDREQGLFALDPEPQPRGRSPYDPEAGGR